MFSILFPSVSAPHTPERFKASAPEPATRRATVLLVEDDDAVRALARRSIERKGYTVYEARNGDEALMLADANFKHLDVVVTDLVMPGMSGREMVRRLREKHGSIKVLFMSGYTADVMENIDQLDGGFLEKPFTPPQLCNAIENAVVMAGTLS